MSSNGIRKGALYVDEDTGWQCRALTGRGKYNTALVLWTSGPLAGKEGRRVIEGLRLTLG